MRCVAKLVVQSLGYWFLSKMVLKEQDLLSGIEYLSQRKKGCTGDLNEDLCLALKQVSQRAPVESNIEHKGIHSPNNDAPKTQRGQINIEV
jgi:hypothetical protein